MSYKEYNNNFFGYDGYIDRKNYIINMLILTVIFLGLQFIKFENFIPYITFKLLYDILIFFAGFLKFVVIISALSVVYRRISDISAEKSQTFKSNIQKFFYIFYIFPFFYIFCRYFIDIIPIITQISDLITIFILIPTGIISAVIFSFIKGN